MADLVSSVQIIARDETAGAFIAATANARLLSQVVEASAAAGDHATASFRQATVSAHELGEARHAIRGLGEEIGVHMPRFVSTYLASLGPVAGVMSMAFAPIAIVGIIEMLGHLPKAIQGGIDSLRGWGAAAKKEFEDSVRFTHEMQKAVEEAADAEYKARMTAGKAGAGKTAAEEAVQNHALGEALNQQAEAHGRILSLTREIHALDSKYPMGSPARATEEAYTWLTKGKERDQATKLLEQAKKDYEEAQKAVVEAGSKRAVGLIEAGPEAENDARKVGEIRLEADRKFTDALISQREKSTKETYALDMMATETEVAVLKGAAKEKADADRAYYEGRIVLARQKERETGESQAAEIYSFQRQEEESRITYWATIESIDNDGIKQQQKAIEEQYKQEHELVELDEKRAEDRRKIWTGYYEDLLKEEEKRFAAAEVYSEMRVAAAKSEAEMQRLQINAAYDAGNISLAERVRRLKEVEEAEYRVAIMAAYQAAGAVVGDPVKTAEAEKKIQEITAAHNMAMEKINIDGAKKSEKPWNQYFQSLESNFNRSINAMITGHEKFRKSVQSMWQGFVTDSLQALERVAEQWLVKHVIMAEIHKVFTTQNAAADAAGAAAQIAVNNTKNVAMATSDVGMAAATAFAEAMAAIPFPANLAAAPAAGWSAFSEGAPFIAAASAARGADLPGENTMVFAHPREMVLPESLANVVRSAAAQGSPRGGGVTNNYHGYPGESPHSISQNTVAWHRAIRDGRLRFV
jgi:hypothetical protein